jgi:hypothetical protein
VRDRSLTSAGIVWQATTRRLSAPSPPSRPSTSRSRAPRRRRSARAPREHLRLRADQHPGGARLHRPADRPRRSVPHVRLRRAADALRAGACSRSRAWWRAPSWLLLFTDGGARLGADARRRMPGPCPWRERNGRAEEPALCRSGRVGDSRPQDSWAPVLSLSPVGAMLLNCAVSDHPTREPTGPGDFTWRPPRVAEVDGSTISSSPPRTLAVAGRPIGSLASSLVSTPSRPPSASTDLHRF